MLAISYFDEVFGPQILEIYPRQASSDALPITNILSVLIDLGSRNDEDNEWNFLYSDKNFSSQNLRKSYVNPQARGGLTDILLSIILHPTHFSHISIIAQSWDIIYDLEKILFEFLEFDEITPYISNREKFNEVFISFYNDVKQKFQNFLDDMGGNKHNIY